MVGLGGLEPPTSPLSGARSSHLSYRPIQLWQQLFLLYRTSQILAILLQELVHGCSLPCLACLHPLSGPNSTSATTNAFRTASAMRSAPVVSPWMQIVCASTTTTVPSSVNTPIPSAIRTDYS